MPIAEESEGISWDWILLVTVKPRVNESLFNAVVGITNDFLYPNSSKIYEKNLDHDETSL